MKNIKFLFGSVVLFCVISVVSVADNVCAQQNTFIQEDRIDFSVGRYSDYVRTKSKKKFVPKNFLTISQINRQGKVFNIYETQGYVVNVYQCPPCLDGAMCKPCMRKNIVISEEATEFNFYSIMDKQMIVFVDERQEFEEGKKYHFVIRILDVKTTDQPINNVDLIYAKRIK